MIRYAIPLLAYTALAMPAAAAEVQVQASGPVVELSVTEQVLAEPDLVTIGAGVTTEAQTAVEALRRNSERMRQVIERIKSLGIPERDIQTTGISLHPQYEYNQQTRMQIFQGYRVSNRVSVKLRDIGETGEVLDALVAAGATDLSGPDFSIQDDEAARAQARRAAMETAQAQALAYARMAGYSDIRLLEVDEMLQAGPPMPMMRMATADVEAQSAAPVQPGRVAAGVTVTVTYEMTR